MSEQPRRPIIEFRGPGTLTNLLIALWFLCYALTTLFKVDVTPTVMGILALVIAILLLVGV